MLISFVEVNHEKGQYSTYGIESETLSDDLLSDRHVNAVTTIVGGDLKQLQVSSTLGNIMII